MSEAKSKGLVRRWLGLLGIVILAGLFAAFNCLPKAIISSTPMTCFIWSLPLGVYIFLALTSSGLTILAAIPLVFGVKKYEPLAKRLVFLAIATLMGGFVSIGLELGNVFHMIYIMLSPNFSSPIWWMGFIYSIELVVLILKFWRLAYRRLAQLIQQASGHRIFYCCPCRTADDRFRIRSDRIPGHLLRAGHVDILSADGNFERIGAVPAVQPAPEPHRW